MYLPIFQHCILIIKFVMSIILPMYRDCFCQFKCNLMQAISQAKSIMCKSIHKLAFSTTVTSAYRFTNTSLHVVYIFFILHTNNDLNFFYQVKRSISLWIEFENNSPICEPFFLPNSNVYRGGLKPASQCLYKLESKKEMFSIGICLGPK